ncbi:hypothetical protein BKD26_10920 [Streptomyces sp. CB03238]|nr:hypothetical protein BKD26_10920 [Streptomyces sp. CB03238]
MVRRWNFRPRQAWRFAYGMSQEEAADRCNALATGEGPALTGKRISEYELWPLGGSRPSIRVLSLLSRVYGVRPIELTDLLDRNHLHPEEISLLRGRSGHPDRPSGRKPVTGAGKEAESTAVVLSRSDMVASVSLKPTPLRHSSTIEEATVMAAAHESSEHAGWAETSNVGASTLETLRDDVTRLSRGLVHLDPLPLFAKMVGTRDRIYRILEGHHHPAQTRELYFLASVVCCLLAEASQTFGYRAAALEQTRAAWAYAEIIGHNSIRTWCRSAQSWYAYRDQRPGSAVALARSGLRLAGRNEASKQRLHSMEGTALAALGDRDGALHAFRLAQEARERMSGADDFFDEVGGVFTADPAKQFHNTANGLILLGLADEAADAAGSSIRLYEQSPEAERDTSLEAGARITLATSRLLRGDLEAARAELRPVLDTDLRLRSEHMRARLLEFAQALRAPVARGAPQVADLRAEIEDFRIPALPVDRR